MESKVEAMENKFDAIESKVKMMENNTKWFLILMDGILKIF